MQAKHTYDVSHWLTLVSLKIFVFILVSQRIVEHIAANIDSPIAVLVCWLLLLVFLQVKRLVWSRVGKGVGGYFG